MIFYRFIFGVIAALTVTTATMTPESSEEPIGPPATSEARFRPTGIYTPPTTSTTTTTLPPVEIDPATPCQQWLPLLLDVGWPRDPAVLQRALRIMYRESRCLPDACSESDSGRICRDWGLFQINDYSWRTTVEAHGYRIEELWNPAVNARFALWLYHYSLDRNGDGFGPWRLPTSTSTTISQ